MCASLITQPAAWLSPYLYNSSNWKFGWSTYGELLVMCIETKTGGYQCAPNNNNPSIIEYTYLSVPGYINSVYTCGMKGAIYQFEFGYIDSNGAQAYSYTQGPKDCDPYPNKQIEFSWKVE